MESGCDMLGQMEMWRLALLWLGRAAPLRAEPPAPAERPASGRSIGFSWPVRWLASKTELPGLLGRPIRL